MSAIDTAKEGGREAASKVEHSTWIEGLARFGYLVRGVLYVLVGILAAQVAVGARSDVEGKAGAIATIAQQPFGKVLLVGVAIGLAGYALWGLVRAVLDPLRKGTSPKGLAQRGGYVVSALSYGSLIVPTINFIRGAGTNANQDQSSGASKETAFLLSQPLGHWLVLVAGLVAIGGALGQGFMGVTAKFTYQFKKSEMSEEELKVATWVGRIGYIARGVVFLLGGIFLVRAALQNDPGQAQSLDGVLATIAGGPFGTIALLVVALGLAAFGVYSIMCTRWIQIVK